MKKLIGLVCAALTLAGCQKEQTHPNGTSTIGALDETKSASYRVYFDNGAQPGVEGQDYGCAGSGGNCLPDVVVTASLKPAIDNVFTAVYTNNDATIRSAFSANRTALLNYVDKAHVDGVINGTLRARARGASPNNRYLIIRRTGGVLVGVYPLR